jgi:hypothetical protein
MISESILTAFVLAGGPTSAARSGLDWLVQFFTSRGYAFVGESLLHLLLRRFRAIGTVGELLLMKPW